MKEINYSKQLYLYDNRSKCDYFMKVTEILYEDTKSILCKAVCFGLPEYENQVEEEALLIDKKEEQVRNSNFDSWLVTSDKKWLNNEIKRMKERYEY